MIDLSTGPRKAVFASVEVAGLVALAAAADLVLAYPYNPFNSMRWFDAVCLVSAALVMFMAHDAWQEFPPGAAPSNHRRKVSAEPMQIHATLQRDSKWHPPRQVGSRRRALAHNVSNDRVGQRRLVNDSRDSRISV